MTFVDTSAMYAWTDAGDREHGTAKTCLRALVEKAEPLVSHSYVLIEALTLVDHRLGREAAVALASDLQKFRIEWVDSALHAGAVERWKRPRRHQVSLVDEVSFLVMQRLGLELAFAFDPDFEREGFSSLASLSPM